MFVSFPSHHSLSIFPFTSLHFFPFSPLFCLFLFHSVFLLPPSFPPLSSSSLCSFSPSSPLFLSLFLHTLTLHLSVKLPLFFPNTFSLLSPVCLPLLFPFSFTSFIPFTLSVSRHLFFLLFHLQLCLSFTAFSSFLSSVPTHSSNIFTFFSLTTSNSPVSPSKLLSWFLLSSPCFSPIVLCSRHPFLLFYCPTVHHLFCFISVALFISLHLGFKNIFLSNVLPVVYLNGKTFGDSRPI